MRTIENILKATILASMVILAASCRHKDLCYEHDSHALRYQVNIKASYELEWEYAYNNGTDWENQWPAEFGFPYSELKPVKPSGLRVLAYADDSKYDLTNMPADGGVLRLRNADNDLLFYNNDTETIIFNDLNTSASASATTRTKSRASYKGSPYIADAQERTVTEPDMLFGQYKEDLHLELSDSAEALPIVMKPLVYTYAIRYEFEEGLEYVALARGAIAGMAESVYLNTGKTSDRPVTVLYECTVEDFGAQAVVKTFGVPDFPNENYTKAGRVYALNLEVRLKNGIVKIFDFNVTDQIEKQPHGGVIVVDGIRIEKEDGEKGGGGFDVDVDDWGEYEDIPLPL